MRPLPSRISNAHGERLLDDITQARLDERRKVARKLHDGPGQELLSTAHLAMEMRDSLGSESNPLTEKISHFAESMEKVVNDLHAYVQSLDANFRDSPWVAAEPETTLMQPHGHRYRILGERLPESAPAGRRLFAL